MKKIIFLVALIILGWVGYQWGTEAIRQKIESELTKQLNRRTFVEKLELKFPLDCELKRIRVFEKGSEVTPDLLFLEIGRLRIRPDLFAWFNGRIGFAGVQAEGARLYLIRNPDGTLNCSDMLTRAGESPKMTYKVWPVVVQSMALREGQVIIVDRLLTPSEGIQTVLSHLQLRLQKIAFPIQPTTVTHFMITGQIGPGIQESEPASKVQLSGWINWLRRDLQAKLSITDLQVGQFKPYFANSKFFSALKTGRITLISEARSQENLLNAQCSIQVSDIGVTSNLPLEERIFGVPYSNIWQWVQQSSQNSSLQLVAKGHLIPFQVVSLNFSTDFMKNMLGSNSNVSLKVQQITQGGKVLVQEGKGHLEQAIQTTPAPKASEKTEKVAQETKQSIQDLLP